MCFAGLVYSNLFWFNHHYTSLELFDVFITCHFFDNVSREENIIILSQTFIVHFSDIIALKDKY